MKLSEAAEKVIRLAQVIRKYWETELPNLVINYRKKQGRGLTAGKHRRTPGKSGACRYMPPGLKRHALVATSVFFRCSTSP
jgi:hypothetical protein